jgi:hypothetical protein
MRMPLSVLALAALALSLVFTSSGLCGILGDELSDDDAVRVCYRVLKLCDETHHYVGYGKEKQEYYKTKLKPYIARSVLDEFMAMFKDTYRPYFRESVFFWEGELKDFNGKHEAQRIVRGKEANSRIVITINDDNVYAGDPGYAYTFTLVAEKSDSVLMNYRVWRVGDLSIARSRY